MDKPGNTVRLSFRSTGERFRKLTEIAQRRGWVNAQGKPNVSHVLNYLIDQLETGVKVKIKKVKRG